MGASTDWQGHEGGYSGKPTALRRLISLFTYPRTFSLRVFKIDDKNRWVEEDARMKRVIYARTVIGSIIVIAVGLHYGGLHSSEVNLGRRLEGLVVTAIIVGVNSVVIAASLILAIHRGQRLRAARHLLVPGRTFLIYLALCSGVYVVAEIWDTLDRNPIIGTLLTISIIPLLFIFWCVVMISVSSFYCANYLFRAAEGHPLMPPILASTGAWTMAAVGPFILGGSVTGPVGILGLVFFVGGPITVTALSIIEVNRLRYVPGLDLRGGPPAAPLARSETIVNKTFAGILPLVITMSVAVAVIASIAVITLHTAWLHAI